MADKYEVIIGGGVASSVFRSLDQLRNSLGGASKLITGLGAQLGAAFSAYKIIQFGASAINAADSLSKLSTETGVAVNALSKFQYAADLAGAGETFRAGMIKFNSTISEAEDKASKARQVFDLLKMSIFDAGGKVKPTEVLFLEFADAINKYADGANKAEIVEAAFGTKHAQFISLFKDGSAGIKDAGKDLDSINGAMTPAMAAQAEAFNDSITRMRAGLSGLAIRITSDVLPSITGLIKLFTDTSLGGGKLSPAMVALTSTFKFFALGVLSAYGILEDFGIAIGQTTAAAWEAVKGNFSTAREMGQQLSKDLDAALAKRREIGAGIRNPTPALVGLADRPDTRSQAPSISGTKGAKRDEIDAAKELYRLEEDRIALKREMVKVDFRLTEVEKRDAQIALLKEEEQSLARQIELLKQKRDMTSDEGARSGIDREINTLSDKKRNTERGRAGMEGEADPRSIQEQMTAATTQLRDEFGTTAQTIARGFKSVIGAAVQSVATGIKGLITGTMTWGNALKNIGGGILNGIIDAVARMFAEWVAGRALAGIAHMLWNTKEMASDIATKTPGAILSSIGSWGLAVVIGLAAVIGAMAAFGGFESGGYTGNGGTSEIAGVVHGKEYVLNAPTTSRWGRLLDDMNAGKFNPEDMGARGGGRTQNRGSQMDVNVSMINDRQDEREFQARDGWKITADKMRKRQGSRG